MTKTGKPNTKETKNTCELNNDVVSGPMRQKRYIDGDRLTGYTNAFVK